MNWKKVSSVVAAVLSLAGCGGITDGDRAVAQQRTVVPTTYTCSTVTYYLGRSFGDSSFAITDPVPDTYAPIDAAGDSITLTSPDGVVFAWTSTALVRAVFIRADAPGTVLGDATNQLWLYASPAGGGAYSGAGVYTEDNTNQRFPAKYIEFCFDPPPPQPGLQITKTAQATFDSSFGWAIDKQTPVTDAVLSTGQQLPVAYTVSLTRVSSASSNWGASGKIVVHNPASVDANIVGVADEVSGVGALTVDCGLAFPLRLAAGGTMECAWSAALPDGAERTNTVTVTTDGVVAGGSATATISFAGVPPTNVIDECATATDSLLGELGTVCDATFTWQYTLNVGPYATCGAYEFSNTASFVTNDTAATGSDTVVLPISLPCVGGCTLTPGYWKTHSKYGPSAYDDTWALLGEDTPFFLSGMSSYQVLWTPSSAGAYFQLARAYVAARLNALNGADTAPVAGAMASATGLFGAYTPQQVAITRTLRGQFVSLASKLEEYNAGLTGPGHCSE